ncbi:MULTISPECIES: flagellar assembly protein FliH [unclassified Methylophaga]|jgi:flagellar assembly protein FliH|uniref:flagellar assembly protein FliH n=1 Tax=unclassified Methylophaga TaxID=2629249 RepID=UPI000C97C7D4|nr:MULTISPECIES: flagellar assembly protein FliH [unclassified Methylophaga]MAP26604.1 flagellar assembly protein FliH [Methylophaga sp.]HBX59068.1 flagellar assembly protein FliH [Methylophaga sp.]HCO00778.1 flagellar assembly protein FliH [Methylophaga sp.]|tara:strand:- start:150 stop:836 length:687 start_codon:yes stop_codon:yes gene_type:complete
MTSSDDLYTTQHANVLSAEELANAYERWEVPRVVSVSDVEAENTNPLTVEALEAVQQAAQEEGFKLGYDEGYQQGHEAGLKAGEADILQQAQQWKALIDSLNNPLKSIDSIVEHDLLSMISLLVRQMVYHELQQKPEMVLTAVREALAVLPVSDRQLKVYLNPEDMELVKNGLKLDEDTGWQWYEDPLVNRGGAKLVTADTTIDATVETRLNNLISRLLSQDNHHEPS